MPSWPSRCLCLPAGEIRAVPRMISQLAMSKCPIPPHPDPPYEPGGTSNIEHPTPNIEWQRESSLTSAFGVRCWMFDVLPRFRGFNARSFSGKSLPQGEGTVAETFYYTSEVPLALVDSAFCFLRCRRTTPLVIQNANRATGALTTTDPKSNGRPTDKNVVQLRQVFALQRMSLSRAGH